MAKKSLSKKPINKKPTPAKTRASRASKPAKKTKTNNLYVVGIGASAGGLEALEKFFKSLSPSTQMAFVVVSHMGVPQKSILPELLQRYTKMKVSQIKDRTKIEPGQVYVIPPNKSLAILNNKLHLMRLTKTSGLKYPINTFFTSLANDQKDKSIGIVLSGTGADGTLGLKDIGAQGGITMAQEPGDAKYSGMPSAAINAGYVDYILEAKRMPQQLLKHLDHTLGTIQKNEIIVPKVTPNFLEKIIILIQHETKHDLSLYKTGTISRRIEKRMSLHNFHDIGHYFRYLQENPGEVRLLFKEMLIGVTSFFRDPEAFKNLSDKTLPQLAKNKKSGYTFRVWVPGVSSGEEAYSLAIIFQELFKKSGKNYKLQIFATDIDEIAINKARAGKYSEDSIADSNINKTHLKNYFIKQGKSYQIKKNIREMVIFAVQNITHDPPFSKLDLVSCRNLLIYMKPEMHKRLMPLFHYTLNPGGILFLGTSETIGDSLRYFTTINKKWKIYKSISSAYSPLLNTNISSSLMQGKRLPKNGRVNDMDNKPRADSITSIVEKLLLVNYVPASVIINEQGDILYVHGRTGRFLEPAPGEANLNVFDMARNGLKAEIRAAARNVLSEKKSIVYKNLKVKHNGSGYFHINLIVRPLRQPELGPSLLLVVFEDAKPKKEPKAAVKSSSAPADYDQRMEELEKELRYTKEDLQTTIEELEASNEELKSSNEELQSTNEELQSTNEELETSREELQTVNEELNTLNEELQSKIDEITDANSDMKNLLDSTKIATVFLDNEMCIKRYTPEISRIIKIIPTDIGRPITDIVNQLNHKSFAQDIERVIQTLAHEEKEIQSESGSWYNVRILPYRTIANVIDGVVITFTDITDKKTLRRLAAVVKDSSDAITVQDLEGKILAWNKGAKKLYGWNEPEALKMNISKIIPQSQSQEMNNFIKKIKQGKTAPPLQTKRINKNGKIINIILTATLLVDDAGQADAIATTERKVV